jgi:hypothetical protein
MSILNTLFGSNPLRKGLGKAARAVTKNAPGPVKQVASEASNTVSRKLEG